MASETITVTWAGVERTVEMAGHAYGAAGRVGEVRLELDNAAREWLAGAEPPGVECDADAPCELWGIGPTPQAALDDLAANLRALAAWALETVGEGVGIVQGADGRILGTTGPARLTDEEWVRAEFFKSGPPRAG